MPYSEALCGSRRPAHSVSAIAAERTSDTLGGGSGGGWTDAELCTVPTRNSDDSDAGGNENETDDSFSLRQIATVYDDASSN